MRFFKILTISITLIFFCAFLYFLFAVVLPDIKNAPLIAYIYLILIFATVIIALVYHFKSYHFYRNKKNVNLSKKLSKMLWAGAISFYCLLLSIAGLGGYDLLIYRIGYMSWRELLFVGGFLCIGSLGILEISILKKRIKTLKEASQAKDDIESIGNTTL